MRKYLLPSVLILLLGVGYGLAQTITKALQLSQDTTGAFSVDTNNGVYFPGHILSTGTAPSLSCGTGSPTVTGNDYSGLITGGTGVTTCTLTFAKAYLTQPWCVITNQTSPATSPIAYSVATTSFAITNSIATGLKYSYFCSSAS
jgi:hypothetical protein